MRSSDQCAAISRSRYELTLVENSPVCTSLSAMIAVLRQYVREFYRTLCMSGFQSRLPKLGRACEDEINGSQRLLVTHLQTWLHARAVFTTLLCWTNLFSPDISSVPSVHIRASAPILPPALSVVRLSLPVSTACERL